MMLSLQPFFGLFSAATLAAANMSVKMGSDILVGRAVLSTSAAILILPATLFVLPPDAATWQTLMVAAGHDVFCERFGRRLVAASVLAAGLVVMQFGG